MFCVQEHNLWSRAGGALARDIPPRRGDECGCHPGVRGAGHGSTLSGKSGLAVAVVLFPPRGGRPCHDGHSAVRATGGAVGDAGDWWVVYVSIEQM